MRKGLEKVPKDAYSTSPNLAYHGWQGPYTYTHTARKQLKITILNLATWLTPSIDNVALKTSGDTA